MSSLKNGRSTQRKSRSRSKHREHRFTLKPTKTVESCESNIKGKKLRNIYTSLLSHDLTSLRIYEKPRASLSRKSLTKSNTISFKKTTKCKENPKFSSSNIVPDFIKCQRKKRLTENQSSVFHHCSEMSNDKYHRERGPSMVSKDSTPKTQLNKAVRVDTYKQPAKGNHKVTAIYSDNRNMGPQTASKEPVSNILQFHRNKQNSRDLPLNSFKNQNKRNSNSRNTKYVHLDHFNRNFKCDETSQKSKKSMQQLSTALQGRVFKHKTLHDLRKKTFNRWSIDLDSTYDSNYKFDNFLTQVKPLKKIDLNSTFKLTTNLSKQPILPKSKIDLREFNINPSHENAKVNKVYDSSLKETDKRMYHCVSKPVIKSHKACFGSMQKNIDISNTISARSNTGTKPWTQKEKNYQNCKALEDAYASYISKWVAGASNSWLDKNDSEFQTKAGSSCVAPSVKKNKFHQQSDVKVEPIFEIFDEENKENDESRVNVNYAKKLEKSKQNKRLKQISAWIGENYDSIQRDTLTTISEYKIRSREHHEMDYLFPMGNSAVKKLEVIKDSLASDKFFSTTISIDPNTWEEGVEHKQLPLDIYTFQCDCSTSQIIDLKWCNNMHKWLSLVFIDRFDPNFNPKTWEEFNKLIEFYHSKSWSDPTDENGTQIVKDLDRTFQTIENYKIGNKGYENTKKLLLKFTQHQVAQEWGYVQGMNFIAAMLVQHSQPDVAFCLFIKIFKKFNLFENYLPGLPGIATHSSMIESLIFKHLRTLNTYFEENSIPIQMYSIELICGLFASKIPIDIMQIFLDNFWERGWGFFYALVITFFEEIQFDLMDNDDPTQIGALPKIQSLKWKRLISKAYDFELGWN